MRRGKRRRRIKIKRRIQRVMGEVVGVVRRHVPPGNPQPPWINGRRREELLRNGTFLAKGIRNGGCGEAAVVVKTVWTMENHHQLDLSPVFVRGIEEEIRMSPPVRLIIMIIINLLHQLPLILIQRVELPKLV